jgi:hypothetical protein
MVEHQQMRSNFGCIENLKAAVRINSKINIQFDAFAIKIVASLAVRSSSHSKSNTIGF